MNKSGLINLNFLAYASSAFILCTALNSHAAIIINEVDYDQPGVDFAEFIELFNTGSTAVSLNNYTIELINGRNSSRYRRIKLSTFNISANGYFVVCGDASKVKNCDYSFTTTNSWIQNGEPEAVALYEKSNLIDSLSYEGNLPPFTEGDFLSIEFSDNDKDTFSLSRIPNGADSFNNAVDFQRGCITPGSANIAGSGDCSIAQVSAVPLPAAAWLFGSGLIGLVGLARRK